MFRGPLFCVLAKFVSNVWLSVLVNHISILDVLKHTHIVPVLPECVAKHQLQAPA